MLLVKHILDECEQGRPKCLAKKDDWHFTDLVGLDKGQYLEKLIQSPESAREIDVHFRGIGQHRFTYEKVVELELVGQELIVSLAVRQIDVEADRRAARFICAFIGGLHPPRVPAGDDCKAFLTKARGKLRGVLVDRVFERGARGAKK